MNPLRRAPVEIQPRGAMTTARKLRIHTRVNGKCWMCGKPVDLAGPGVRYDHKLPLELGGLDEDGNLFPLHTTPCDVLKTKADRKRIDKAKRLAAREDGTRRERKPIPHHVNPWPPSGARKLESRGFSPSRKENGTP